MPSFQDSAFLVLLALLLFGPKGLAKLARELGRLMGEFRRASNEFRLQMEDEFRLTEQAEQQKKIAAIEAAAPVAPAFASEIAEPEHPHTPVGMLEAEPDPQDPNTEAMPYTPPVEAVPIATAGEIEMHPPATGLPVSRSASSSSLGPVFDSIPQAPAEVHNG